MDTNNIVKQVQEGIKYNMIKYKEDTDKQFEELKEENKTLKEEVVKLSEQPASTPIKSVVEQIELNKNGRILRALRN